MDKNERVSLGFKGRKEYGDIGEEFFIKYFKMKNDNVWELRDVRDDPYFQNIDIDFLAYRKEYMLYGTSSENIFNDCKSISYEVKTGTQIEKYNELCFELSCGSRRGWACRTKAQYIFYISIDKDKKPVRAFVVDFKKWVDYCDIIYLPKEERHLSYNTEQGICDIYCNVESLKNHNVILKEIIL